MRTIRRLYFYVMAFISLEVVLWGAISLLRNIFVSDVIGGASAQLAEGLALLLVGLPVFTLHWWVVQKDSRNDPDEHSSAIRAFSLYALLLATLIPLVQNLVAILARLFLSLSHLPSSAAVFGGQQTLADNAIAILMNALVAAYFITVLHKDWKEVTYKGNFTLLRRIARYIWVLYGLLLAVAGIQMVLFFIMQIPPFIFGNLVRSNYINGMALVFVGTPLWFYCWKTVQVSLKDPAERDSLLRLGLLYALSLVGVISVLTAGGMVLYALLRQAFGEGLPLQAFIQQISTPLSIGVPLAGIWAYYGHWLTESLAAVPDAPRRSGLRRLYIYILSAIGLGATFIGLCMLLAFIVDISFGNQVWGEGLRLSLSAALATLGAGLPLWLVSWRPIQMEALAQAATGDHARRSIVRRIYLYLALFASVIGGMVSAGSLVFRLINNLLAGGGSDILVASLKDLATLILFILLGVYHGLGLRRDGRTSGKTLLEKHAAFSTLILDVEGGSFGPAMLALLKKHTPHIPVTLQSAKISMDQADAPRAVIMPAELVLDMPGGLKTWLEGYKGSQLVVPSPASGMIWVGASHSDLGQAAHILRQLAEGQEPRQKMILPAGMTIVFIMAGLFSLELLGFLFALVASTIFR